MLRLAAHVKNVHLDTANTSTATPSVWLFRKTLIAYKKGLDDGRENSWRKQPLRDIDKKREARKMKREILFRGKSIQNGKWLYGNIQIPEAPYDEYFMWDNGWQMQVDPDTIGQYIITPMNCAMFPKI